MGDSIRTTVNFVQSGICGLRKKLNEMRKDLSVPVSIDNILADFLQIFYAEKKKLKGYLSKNEAMLIVDAQNAYLNNGATASLLQHQIYDAIELEGLANKWEVDGPDLIKKLEALSHFEKFVIEEMAEECWSRAGASDDMMNIVKDVF